MTKYDHQRPNSALIPISIPPGSQEPGEEDDYISVFRDGNDPNSLLVLHIEFGGASAYDPRFGMDIILNPDEARQVAAAIIDRT